MLSLPFFLLRSWSLIPLSLSPVFRSPVSCLLTGYILFLCSFPGRMIRLYAILCGFHPLFPGGVPFLLPPPEDFTVWIPSFPGSCNGILLPVLYFRPVSL